MPFPTTAAYSLRQLKESSEQFQQCWERSPVQLCTSMVYTHPEWHIREEALVMTLAQGQGEKMLQESQSRRWCFVLQIKDALQVWSFTSHPSFCLISMWDSLQWWLCCCQHSPTSPQREGERKLTEYCMIRGRERHRQWPHCILMPISKCFFGPFLPSFISPPNSTSHNSALLTMAHWTPRHLGFPFGNSGNASCFSPLSFLGLDLQGVRWGVCAAHPICLRGALFQCRACTTRTHCQTSAWAVAWLGHCCRHRTTANTQQPLRMVGMGLCCLRFLWTQHQGLLLVLYQCWWQVQLCHTTAPSARAA